MSSRSLSFVCTLLAMLAAAASMAAAEESVFEVMKKRCVKERESFCSSVSSRDLRIAACLYAHEDKASAQCAVAIYDGWLASQAATAALGKYAQFCRSDLLKYCASVKAGEGGLYDCLLENRPSLSNECQGVLDLAKPELRKLGIAR